MTETMTCICETAQPWPCPIHDEAVCQQHDALRVVSEGINSVIDNWMHWTPEYTQRHLLGLQSIAMAAYKRVEGGL